MDRRSFLKAISAIAALPTVAVGKTEEAEAAPSEQAFRLVVGDAWIPVEVVVEDLVMRFKAQVSSIRAGWQDVDIDSDSPFAMPHETDSIEITLRVRTGIVWGKS